MSYRVHKETKKINDDAETILPSLPRAVVTLLKHKMTKMTLCSSFTKLAVVLYGQKVE